MIPKDIQKKENITMVSTFKTEVLDTPDAYLNNDPIEDNFDTMIKSYLTNPTSEEMVTKAVGDDESIIVKLWRGTTKDMVYRMISSGSAGGVIQNAQIGRPTEQEAQRQVGHGAGLPEPPFRNAS
ncbi:MAG: hypothetical protein GY729_22335 [Desulfobacteraceae bacterium]|nr:hypothetical protein [Desulfobacteraceae bacterium]